jgi:hypothetical protein
MSKFEHISCGVIAGAAPSGVGGIHLAGSVIAGNYTTINEGTITLNSAGWILAQEAIIAKGVTPNFSSIAELRVGDRSTDAGGAGNLSVQNNIASSGYIKVGSPTYHTIAVGEISAQNRIYSETGFTAVASPGAFSSAITPTAVTVSGPVTSVTVGSSSLIVNSPGGTTTLLSTSITTSGYVKAGTPTYHTILDGEISAQYGIYSETGFTAVAAPGTTSSAITPTSISVTGPVTSVSLGISSMVINTPGGTTTLNGTSMSITSFGVTTTVAPAGVTSTNTPSLLYRGIAYKDAGGNVLFNTKKNYGTFVSIVVDTTGTPPFEFFIRTDVDYDGTQKMAYGVVVKVNGSWQYHTPAVEIPVVSIRSGTYLGNQGLYVSFQFSNGSNFDITELINNNVNSLDFCVIGY